MSGVSHFEVSSADTLVEDRGRSKGAENTHIGSDSRSNRERKMKLNITLQGKGG